MYSGNFLWKEVDFKRRGPSGAKGSGARAAIHSWRQLLGHQLPDSQEHPQQIRQLQEQMLRWTSVRDCTQTSLWGKVGRPSSDYNYK